MSTSASPIEAGENLFAAAIRRKTQLLLNALGGLKAAMAESMLIFAPNANSYRRFRRNSYAPVSASWGIDNRTVSLRIPAGAAPTLPHRAPPGRRRCQSLSGDCRRAGRHALRHHREARSRRSPVTGNGYEKRASTFPELV